MNVNFRIAFSVFPQRRVLAICALSLAIMFLLEGPANAQVPAPAANAGSAATSNGLNKVAEAAAQQGAVACGARISQVSNFLGFNEQAGAVLMVPPGQPDQRVLPMVMETATESGPAYVSATFAPNQANGCGATYDAMIYWPLKCEAVAAKQFPTLKKVGQLKKDITVLDGGVATKVFLMPAGSGCVSIKKEVVL